MIWGIFRGPASRWIQIGVFFGLATVLWLSRRLAENYRSQVELPVRYVNLPPKYKLNNKLPSTLNVSVFGPGNRLIFSGLHLDNDTLNLNLVSAAARGYIVTGALERQVYAALKGQFKIERISPDTIPLRFEMKVSKVVPVVPNVTYTLTDGYLFTRPIKVLPDSVRVIGTRQKLERITKWPTEALKLNAIVSSDTYRVALAHDPEVALSVPDVKVSTTVEKFTEGRVEVPVELLNVPMEHSLRISPILVQVRYLVPFSRYEAVKPEDFKVGVDYNHIKPEATVVFPELLQQPEFVRSVHLTPEYLRFVITRPK